MLALSFTCLDLPPLFAVYSYLLSLFLIIIYTNYASYISNRLVLRPTSNITVVLVNNLQLLRCYSLVSLSVKARC